MKLYAVVSAFYSEDGDLFASVVSLHRTIDKAKAAVKESYKQSIQEIEDDLKNGEIDEDEASSRKNDIEYNANFNRIVNVGPNQEITEIQTIELK